MAKSKGRGSSKVTATDPKNYRLTSNPGVGAPGVSSRASSNAPAGPTKTSVPGSWLPPDSMGGAKVLGANK